MSAPSYAAPQEAPSLAPLGAGERLHALDILRGLALFVMILVHFHQKMRLEVTGPEDLIAWTAPLAVFGTAGRMALTNYMLQAAVLDALASGYGLGLRLRPLAYVVAAVLLFAAEAAFSRAWLRRYRFGPLEWVWRTVTYARTQPLRRDAVALGGVTVS